MFPEGAKSARLAFRWKRGQISLTRAQQWQDGKQDFNKPQIMRHSICLPSWYQPNAHDPFMQHEHIVMISEMYARSPSHANANSQSPLVQWPCPCNAQPFPDRKITASSAPHPTQPLQSHSPTPTPSSPSPHSSSRLSFLLPHHAPPLLPLHQPLHHHHSYHSQPSQSHSSAAIPRPSSNPAPTHSPHLSDLWVWWVQGLEI